MAAPGMIILPIMMEHLERYPFMQRIKFLHAPLQVMLVGCFLIFMVPAACSLFPQRCSMKVSKLEPELRDSITAKSMAILSTLSFQEMSKAALEVKSC
ncbi:sideroflexin-2-like isoform X1 [Rhincodon typus]|uniref:sideroflexin-2-like isoform X1 n=1 Tax=Rhincodon typus TaxID=259920 RepID=UPI00202DB745|nr:sideroflexin-2-like isoform X1 [Rhincodon typus]